MKKTIVSIYLIFLSLSVVQAQDNKPTKEETIAFIKKTMSSVIGSEYVGGTIDENEFGLDQYEYKIEVKELQIKQSVKYTTINWENLVVGKNSKTHRTGDNAAGIILFFSSKVKYTEEWNVENMNKDEYRETIELIIPGKKFESIWKACLRLAEIAKEENKDPFVN